MKMSITFSSPFHKFLVRLDPTCTTASSPGRHVIHVRSLTPSFLKTLELVMLSGTWTLGRIRKLVLSAPGSQMTSLRARPPFQTSCNPWKSIQRMKGLCKSQQLHNNLRWRDLKTLLQGEIGREGSHSVLLLSLSMVQTTLQWNCPPEKHVPAITWSPSLSEEHYLQLSAQAPAGF